MMRYNYFDAKNLKPKLTKAGEEYDRLYESFFKESGDQHGDLSIFVSKRFYTDSIGLPVSEYDKGSGQYGDNGQ